MLRLRAIVRIAQVFATRQRSVDSTDSELRYMAYGARLRTVLRAGHRYIAYVRVLAILTY